MSLAQDYGDIIKLLVNDTSLKTLMNIPTAELNDYGILIEKYFLQTFVNDKFVDDGVCRLLLRSGMQMDTTNDFVKWTGIVIELYTPTNKDSMSGFQSRSNLLADKLIELLNREVINHNKIYFSNSYELPSQTANYKRLNVRFDYKKIYH